MSNERYDKAKKRVEELKKFYSNVVTFVVVNLVLIIINLVTSPGSLWFYWVTIFWGIAILLHGSRFTALGSLSSKANFLEKSGSKKRLRKLWKKKRGLSDKERNRW